MDIRQTGNSPGDLSPENCQQILQQRAELLKAIRQYFDEQQLLEVQTPSVLPAAIPDTNIDLLEVTSRLRGSVFCNRSYLQSSPELAMKTLLLKGSGSIYQIAKVFRDDPLGRLHQPEFTMLEWYRIDFDMQQLIEDVKRLIKTLSKKLGCDKKLSIEQLSYSDCFERYLNIDVFEADAHQLKALALSNIDLALSDDASQLNKDFWLDLLFSHLIEPKFDRDHLTIVVHYPASQAALAKTIAIDGCQVALRFECFWQGVELANGYQELTTVTEYREQFNKENQQRLDIGKRSIDVDEGFLSLLKISGGLPVCSGVALGVDRLMAALYQS